MKTAALLMISIVFANSEPIAVASLNIGSREYVAASVEKESDTTAKVTHDAGIAHVKMLDLPKDVREKIGFDSGAAEQAKAKEDALTRRQQQLEARAIAKAEILRGISERMAAKKFTGHPPTGVLRVTEIQPGGLVGNYGFTHPKAPLTLYTFSDYGPGAIFVVTRMKDGKFVDGQKFPVAIIRDGTHTFTTVLGASRTIQKWKDIELVLDERFPETIAP